MPGVLFWDPASWNLQLPTLITDRKRVTIVGLPQLGSLPARFVNENKVTLWQFAIKVKGVFMAVMN